MMDFKKQNNCEQCELNRNDNNISPKRAILINACEQNICDELETSENDSCKYGAFYGHYSQHRKYQYKNGHLCRMQNSCAVTIHFPSSWCGIFSFGCINFSKRISEIRLASQSPIIIVRIVTSISVLVEWSICI